MREVAEEIIRQIPVYQYAFVRSEDLQFRTKVRNLCRTDCPYYGTSWSCPPAVGRLEKNRQRCLAYPEALVYSTYHAEEGSAEERLIRRRDHGHEDVSRQVEDALLAAGFDVFTLSSSVCSICAECAFPRDGCRHLDRMHPCIESAGLVIADIAGICNMDHYFGEQWRLSFSISFYREQGRTL